MNPFDILDSDFDISCFQTVDDDIVNQEIIKGILAETYDEIAVAMNGYEALEFLSTSNDLPDLVLLDVMMPGKIIVN